MIRLIILVCKTYKVNALWIHLCNKGIRLSEGPFITFILEKKQIFCIYDFWTQNNSWLCYLVYWQYWSRITSLIFCLIFLDCFLFKIVFFYEWYYFWFTSDVLKRSSELFFKNYFTLIDLEFIRLFEMITIMSKLFNA